MAEIGHHEHPERRHRICDARTDPSRHVPFRRASLTASPESRHKHPRALAHRVLYARMCFRVPAFGEVSYRVSSCVRWPAPHRRPSHHSPLSAPAAWIARGSGRGRPSRVDARYGATAFAGLHRVKNRHGCVRPPAAPPLRVWPTPAHAAFSGEGSCGRAAGMAGLTAPLNRPFVRWHLRRVKRTYEPPLVLRPGRPLVQQSLPPRARGGAGNDRRQRFLEESAAQASGAGCG